MVEEWQKLLSLFLHVRLTFQFLFSSGSGSLAILDCSFRDKTVFLATEIATTTYDDHVGDSLRYIVRDDVAAGDWPSGWAWDLTSPLPTHAPISASRHGRATRKHSRTTKPFFPWRDRARERRNLRCRRRQMRGRDGERTAGLLARARSRTTHSTEF